MHDPLAAWSDFIAQPFGVVGAICIMLAVTAINSHRLASKLKTGPASGPTIFNGLNLVGGTSLLINAIIRSEVVWVVLETYFVIVAIKGLVQLQQTQRAVRDRAAAAATGPKEHPQATVEAQLQEHGITFRVIDNDGQPTTQRRGCGRSHDW